MADCRRFETCGLVEEPGEAFGLCILHSKNAAKDRSKFRDALVRHNSKKNRSYRAFVFPEAWSFDHEVFTEDIDFEASVFARGASFNHCTFERGGIFRKVQFDDDVFFRNCSSAMRLFFTNAKFLKGAYFDDAHLAHTSFRCAEFLGRVEFRHATFDGPAMFGESTFDQLASFFETTFRSVVQFKGVEFKGHVAFNRTKFEGEGTDFRFTKFKDGASFHDAAFSHSVNFEKTEFLSPTFFNSAVLQNARFIDALFEKQVDFRNTVFVQKAAFSGATFKSKAVFTGGGKSIEDQIIPIFTGCNVNFRGVAFEEHGQLTFQDASFAKCKFLNVDLSKIDLIGIEWPRKRGRFVVFDDIEARKESSVFPWSGVEQLYRDLKRYYETKRDYERAGDFHYGEKNTRRRDPSTHSGLRTLLWLYWIVSGYGERVIRPLVWCMVVLGAGSMTYVSLGIFEKTSLVPAYSPSIKVQHFQLGSKTFTVTDTIYAVSSLTALHGRRLELNSMSDLVRASLFSLQIMLLQKPDELTVSDDAIPIRLTENILGPVLFGLFALALRQRLKR